MQNLDSLYQVLRMLLVLFQTTESSDVFYPALKIILGQGASFAEVT